MALGLCYDFLFCYCPIKMPTWRQDRPQEEELRYTKADLEDLVRAFQGKPLRTFADLSSY